MPKRRTLDLTPEQYQELVDCRDHHRLPYLRERAVALLLIAAGLTPAWASCQRSRKRELPGKAQVRFALIVVFLVDRTRTPSSVSNQKPGTTRK